MFGIRSLGLVAGAAAMTIAAFASTADAGIVNVQSKLAGEVPQGFSGTFSGSADWRTGNTDLLVVGGSQVVNYLHGSNLLVAILRGEFGRSADTRIIAKTFEHLRFRHFINETYTAEVFTQHEYDQFRRLELRALVGVGPKINFLRSEELTLSWGIAYMFEYEQLRDDEEIDAGATDAQHRISTYLTGNLAIKEDLSFIQTVYAQPRLTDPEDYRILNESQIAVNITEKIALKTSFVLAYDTRPPASIEELDTALKSEVSISFD